MIYILSVRVYDSVGPRPTFKFPTRIFQEHSSYPPHHLYPSLIQRSHLETTRPLVEWRDSPVSSAQNRKRVDKVGVEGRD